MGGSSKAGVCGQVSPWSLVRAQRLMLLRGRRNALVGRGFATVLSLWHVFQLGDNFVVSEPYVSVISNLK